MKITENQFRSLVRKEIYHLLTEQEDGKEPIEYNPSVVIRLVTQDDFLEQAFDDHEGSVDDRLRFVFDEHIRGESDLERLYRSEKEKLEQELTPEENGRQDQRTD